jgi:hypothetical protein
MDNDAVLEYREGLDIGHAIMQHIVLDEGWFSCEVTSRVSKQPHNINTIYNYSSIFMCSTIVSVTITGRSLPRIAPIATSHLLSAFFSGNALGSDG